MNPFLKTAAAAVLLAALASIAISSLQAFEKQEKAGLPTLLTSCGQRPGPVKLEVFLKRLKFDFAYVPRATANDLIEKKKSGTTYKSIIVVAGASLKGMGAAGVSINDEIERTKALISEAKKQGIKVIGAHIEGMARRSQGAAAGDKSDELSIDAVCPQSSLLLIRKDGDEDGRFTKISKSKNIPMISFEKNMELENVLKSLFSN
ncbi:MAG TPA: DUF6305 family protein [Acidobacteriota bacterium]|nr:DUF6305 family protein [Acidobacteriota bacterium]